MAVIVADGYSFGPSLPGFATSDYSQVISFGPLLLGFATSDYNEVFSSGPYLSGFSDSSNIDNKLLPWQSPYFVNEYCPTVGAARPTTGQVYPRGYN
jgi:hypothetical protein